jgi:hypothetical protein
MTTCDCPESVATDLKDRLRGHSKRLFRAAKATSAGEAIPCGLATVADSQDAQLRIRLLAPFRAPYAQSFLSNVPPLEGVEAAGYLRRPGQEQRAG